jgi:ornithine cyclodeaminase/alanine dehydrogenase-like protein (mu-crystallin family)
VLRAVGGGAYGVGRVGIRVGGVSLVFATAGNELLGIVGSGYSNLRVGALVGLAARAFARADAHAVALLGSGRLALSALEGLCAIGSIERISVYSPTREHREAFARRAAAALKVPVTAMETREAALDGADIVALGTNSSAAVIREDDVPPGTHVASWGEPFEIDASVYAKAALVVVSSWRLEYAMIDPKGQYLAERKGLGPPPLWTLLSEGRLAREKVVELGAVAAGSSPAPTSRDAITVFRESQGGAGDIALAGLAFDRAKALGRGVEYDFLTG